MPDWPRVCDVYDVDFLNKRYTVKRQPEPLSLLLEWDHCYLCDYFARALEVPPERRVP